MAHISENGYKTICEICDRYANEKTPLIMILSDVQKEYGYVPLEVQEVISEKTGISVRSPSSRMRRQKSLPSAVFCGNANRAAVASAFISNAMFGVESDRADAACAAASTNSAERKARLIQYLTSSLSLRLPSC